MSISFSISFDIKENDLSGTLDVNSRVIEIDSINAVSDVNSLLISVAKLENYFKRDLVVWSCFPNHVLCWSLFRKLSYTRVTLLSALPEELPTKGVRVPLADEIISFNINHDALKASLAQAAKECSFSSEFEKSIALDAWRLK